MDNLGERSQQVVVGVARAARGGMVAMLDAAFTDALMDLSALHRADPDFHYHSKQVDYTVSWLCDAAEAGAEDVGELAIEAQRAVQRLAAILEEADSDDRRTREKLDLAREAVAGLLAALREVAKFAA
jgi:hypothetical protein